jgi:ABC-type transport system involved in multi-copper enzyme maturation permease subunit
MRMPIIWKEWHEQRWRLAFGTVMLTGLIGSLAAAQIMTIDEVEIIFAAAAAIVLPLYSAMGVFAPERSNRTLEFYAAKPASPGRVFLAKWFFGWLNVVVPVIATAIFALIVTGPVATKLSDPSRLLSLVTVLFFGTVFYSMTCCLGPFRRGEAIAGLCGLLILGLMIIYPFALSYFIHDILHLSVSHPGYPSVFTAFFSVSPVLLLDIRFDQPRISEAYIAWVVQFFILAGTVCIGNYRWRRGWRP